jgi:hypothetical protein
MAALFIFPPVILDKTGLATEAKQDAQITELQNIVTEINNLELDVENININVDDLEALQTDANAKLDTANSNLSDIEADLVLIAGYVDGIEAGQTATNASLDNIEADVLAQKLKTAASLVPEAHDYIALAYVGATTDIFTATYKLGGASGTTVAVLTLGYDGSNRLTSVTRS